MNYWIRAYNQTNFRVDDFIRDHGFIDWTMRNKFRIGDIVFLYATAPKSCLTYMMEVSKIGIDYRESFDDSDYYISQESYKRWIEQRQFIKYVRFQFLKQLNSPALCFCELMEHGLGGAPRSPRRLYLNTVDYILEHIE